VQPAVPKIENVFTVNLVFDFEGIWRTSVEIGVVCLGVLCFLEPLCVRFRTWLGFPESRHKHASLRVKILLLGIVAASTLGHHLLDYRARKDFGLTLFMLASVTATTGVTTYAWMRGFLQRPRHAALFGFLAGLLSGYFFAFPLAQIPELDPAHPGTVLTYMMRPLKPWPLIQSSLTSVPVTYFNLWRLPQAPITTIAVVAPAVFGLAGGLMINEKGQRKLTVWNMLTSFVIAGGCLTAVVLLLLWILHRYPSGGISPEHMRLSGQMLLGMIAAALAWLSGLGACNFTGSLAGRHPSSPRAEDPAGSRRAAALLINCLPYRMLVLALAKRLCFS
jgi:hypothetical protein